MLDLSVFAIGLVAGWSMMFLRWPGAGVRACVLVAAIWFLWVLGLAALARWTGVPWGLVAAGLGLAGHSIVLIRAKKGGL